MATRSPSWFPSIKTYTARRRQDSMWFRHLPLKNRQGHDSHDQCAFAHLHGLEAHSKTSAWNHGMGFPAPGTLAVMCEHILNIPIPSPEIQSQTTSKKLRRTCLSCEWSNHPYHINRVMAAATSPSGIRNDVLLPDVSRISVRSCWWSKCWIMLVNAGSKCLTF